MFHITSRLQQIEIQIAQWLRDWTDLLARLVKLEQNPWLQQGPQSGSGSSSAVYVVMAPSSGTYAGTWSGSAPTAGGSFSGTVYQVSGTGTVTNLGSQTCVNWMPGALAPSKACYCLPDGAGNYAVINQSCQ